MKYRGGSGRAHPPCGQVLLATWPNISTERVSFRARSEARGEPSKTPYALTSESRALCLRQFEARGSVLGQQGTESQPGRLGVSGLRRPQTRRLRKATAADPIIGRLLRHLRRCAVVRIVALRRHGLSSPAGAHPRAAPEDGEVCNRWGRGATLLPLPFRTRAKGGGPLHAAGEEQPGTSRRRSGRTRREGTSPVATSWPRRAARCEPTGGSIGRLPPAPPGCSGA
jgi:hypothetical protein